MANYATQANVEGVLGRSLSSSESDALPFLLNAIDEFIDDAVGSAFTIPDDPATKYYDAEPSVILEIDPVYVDEDHGLIVSLVDADENVLSELDTSAYEARPRNEAVKTYIQHRNGLKWASEGSSAVANIAVSGYFGRGEEAPADIQYLAAYLAAKYIGATKSGELKSESIEGYSRTFATIQADYPIVEQTLSKYRTEVLL